MIVLILSCLVTSVMLAGLASRRPDLRASTERVSGGLLVLGLVLIGAGLPLFR